MRAFNSFSFQKLLYPSQGLVSLPQGESSIAVGDMRVVETGPLAGFSPNILDTGKERNTNATKL